MADGILTGRNALVTGSVDGLGLAMARTLAGAGSTIVLTGIDGQEKGDGVARALADETGVAVRYLSADLTRPDAVRALVDQAGPVDILINNAVVRHFAPIADFPLDKWNEALAVNLTAALLATQRALPGMRARNYGRIINMTSVYGSRAVVDRVDYVTTKTAIQGLTRAIAMEVAGSGVSCHALTPGSVMTPIWADKVEAMMRDEGLSFAQAEARFLAGKQPSGKFVEVESVAAVLLLLCGPTGADMNGAILPIEGGWLARA
jgi:3-hydroxybutyrate dehydrogenase